MARSYSLRKYYKIEVGKPRKQYVPSSFLFSESNTIAEPQMLFWRPEFIGEAMVFFVYQNIHVYLGKITLLSYPKILTYFLGKTSFPFLVLMPRTKEIMFRSIIICWLSFR